MTVIVGVTDGAVAWLGADSCGLDIGGLIWTANDKVIRMWCDGAPALLAFSGNGRLKGAMRDSLVLPSASLVDDLDTWARQTARLINDIALDARPPIADADGDGSFDGIALLAFRGGLWRIAADTAISIPRSAAIGSGGDIAHGAMRALDAAADLAPEAMVELALRITCTEQSDCSAPWTIASTARD